MSGPGGTRPDTRFAWRSIQWGPAEWSLALLAMLLAVGVAIGALVPVADEAPAGRFALSPHAAPTDDGRIAEIDEAARIALARPLFSPNRRPPATTAAPTQMPRLAGLVVAAGVPPRAIFAATGDGKPPVLTVGQEIAGHTIRQIGVASITLEDGTVLRPAFAAAATGDAALNSAAGILQSPPPGAIAGTAPGGFAGIGGMPTLPPQPTLLPLFHHVGGL